MTNAKYINKKFKSHKTLWNIYEISAEHLPSGKQHLPDLLS